jgi:CheY-like chemotaxis protein
MSTRPLRIGGASGFWGDSSVGAPQLVERGDVDVLVFDYLAELTMSLLAGARLKDPGAGYATDFVSVAMASVLPEVVRRGIRVISNAGGVNPRGCAQALQALAARQGLTLKIAVVLGDDLMPQLDTLRLRDTRHLHTGQALPQRLLSANAYLGALPIARALDAGAQVVITGRCVDSAVTLGALMHHFRWPADDFDRLAAGSLAGHIIECGCQATGGLFTDWQQVPDWAHIGYPVVECHDDGHFVVTKPPGTGGLVTPATVGEQLLYEIGDPAAYLLPDVRCDFTPVTMQPDGPDRVRVDGARGRAPPPSYKVSATYASGYRCNAELLITGFDAAAKAQRSGEALLARVRGLFAAQGLGDFSDTLIDVIGAERAYGPLATPQPPRQAVMRVAVTHADKAALALFAREVSAAGTSWAPGTTGLGGGRPSVALSIRQFPFLVDKALVTAQVEIDGPAFDVPIPAGSADALDTPASAASPGADRAPTAGAPDPELITVPLIRLAWGRSGDKGDTSNIGILARRPELLPVLRAQLTEAAVAAHLAHLVRGTVTRYELPGIGALNFVCSEALGGGGMASLRSDPLGKGMAQVLLAMPVQVGAALLALLRP